MIAQSAFIPAFDYARFESQDLVHKAKDTLSNFLNFVRQTFDNILSIGKELQELYEFCLASCSNGKKIFKQWLDSRNFGASSYIAKSAMQLYKWFTNLDPRIQRLVCDSVQDWKVSALRHLKYLTDDVLEIVVTSGKKTAAQVKELSSKVSQIQSSKKTVSCDKQDSQSAGDTKEFTAIANQSSEITIASESIDTNSLEPASTSELTPGTRMIVINDDNGWNGHSGIIISIAGDNKFWVLLDQTVAQGIQVKHLLKSHQIQLEPQKVSSRRTSTQMLSPQEVEQIKAEAIKQYQLEKAEEEQKRFIEIRDAALEAAKKEIIAFEKHAKNMELKVSNLTEQLEVKEREIVRLNSLNVKNQQLEQRVTELENAVVKASEGRWANTFSSQAAIVVNSDIEAKIAPLMAEIERLQNLVEQKNCELAQIMQQSLYPDCDSIVSSLGEIREISHPEFVYSGDN